MSTDAPDELPEGWQRVAIRDGVAVNYGKALQENVRKQGKFAVYGSGGVVGEHTEPFTSGETIVIGRKGSVGSVFHSPEACWPIDTTYYVTEFGPFLPRYFYHWLRFQKLSHLDTSSAIPGLNREDLYSQIVPLAPLEEQGRIVTAVERLLEKVSSARERLERVLRTLTRFRQAVLASACSGRLTDDWREHQSTRTSGDELIAEVSEQRRKRYAALCELAGRSKKPRPKPFDNEKPRLRDDLELPDIPDTWAWVDLRFVMDEGIAFCYGVVQPGESGSEGNFLVRAGDISSGMVDCSQLRRISKKVDEDYRRSRLSGGEILVTVVGAGIGNAALVPNECSGFNIARALAKVPVRDFDTQFILRWIESTQARQWMTSDAREVARPTLNLEQLQTLPVPLPTLEEQREIVRRIEQLFKLTDKVEQQTTSALKRAELMTQAILAKAFRGELVPTEAELARNEGRSYEPASELLARLKASTNGEVKRPRAKRIPKGTSATGEGLLEFMEG